MDAIIRHIPRSSVMSLADQVDYQPGQVARTMAVDNQVVHMVLFAFDQGSELTTHEAGGDALVTILEGSGRITLDGVEHVMSAGQSIIMPAKTPHSVFGIEPFKMSLLVVFPS